MKTTTLFFGLPLLCLSLPLRAQLHAGDLGEVIYTPVGIEYEFLTNPPNTFIDLSDSVDVNADGTDDLAFGVILSNNPDFVGGVSQVFVLHPEVEVMVTNYNATQLQMGELILPDSGWSNELNWTFAANFIGFAGPTEYGEWQLGDHLGYMAFRLLEQQDTLYGWFDVFAESGETFVKLKVYGFGLDSGLNATEEIPGEVLQLFPNPASGYLTIPQDGYDRIAVYGPDGRLARIFSEHDQLRQIDLSGLPPGVYQVVLYAGKQRPRTGRILVVSR